MEGNIKEITNFSARASKFVTGLAYPKGLKRRKTPQKPRLRRAVGASTAQTHSPASTHVLMRISGPSQVLQAGQGYCDRTPQPLTIRLFRLRQLASIKVVVN